MISSSRHRWLGVSLSLLAAVVFVRAVSAHASLVRSEPSSGAILAEPPGEMRLWFNEPISPVFSGATLFNPQSQQVDLEAIRVDEEDPTLMYLTLPDDLAVGLYSLRWRVLSEADGHITQGVVVFGIGEISDISPSPTVSVEPSLPVQETALRWLNLILLMSLIGAVSMPILVLDAIRVGTAAEASLEGAIETTRRRIYRWAVWGGVFSLLVGAGLLALQVQALLPSLPEDVAAMDVLTQLLGSTRWGGLWWLRQGVLALAVVSVVFLRLPTVQAPRGRSLTLSPGVAQITAFLAVCGLVVVQALSGHAAALTPNTALAIFVDAVHLLAGGLWVGGLIALLVGFYPFLFGRAMNRSALIRAGWGAFSPVAAISVSLVLTTGLYNTGRQVASLDAIVASLYGKTLLGKVGLMFAMGALGLMNAALLHPRWWSPLARRFGKPAGWTPLRLAHMPRLVLLEVGAGLTVLLAAALITALPQPRGAEYLPGAVSTAAFQSQSVNDLLVTLSALPNKPGENVFTVRAVSTRRPPPAKTLRLILHFEYQAQDFERVSTDAVEIEPGLYQFVGSPMNLAGSWLVEVVVRREGLEDSVARFNWYLASQESAATSLLSGKPLEPLLSTAAALILIILLIAISLTWARRRHEAK